MSTPPGSGPIWNRRSPRRACASTSSEGTHEGGNAGARGAGGVIPGGPAYDRLAMRGGMDRMFLGAAQIDQHLRLNLTVIGDRDRPRVRLPGGGGAAVLAQVIPHVVVWRTRHTPEIFVPKVDFITAQGNVEAVVTPLGVLRALDGRLVLDARFPGVSPEEIVARTGFPVLPPGPVRVFEPTGDELRILGELDPGRRRELEFTRAPR